MVLLKDLKMKLSNQTEVFLLLSEQGYDISFPNAYPERFLFADKNNEQFDVTFKDDLVTSISCKVANGYGCWSLYPNLTWKWLSVTDLCESPLSSEIKSLAESIMVKFR